MFGLAPFASVSANKFFPADTVSAGKVKHIIIIIKQQHIMAVVYKNIKSEALILGKVD